MENKNFAFRAFLGSVLALILCFLMLIGTTFAWFTDSVSSDNNIITAGNLDIELYHTDKHATDEKVTETTKLFDDVDSDLWEPGAIAYEKLTIKNEGDLRLKYKMTLNAMNATVKNGVSFASMLKVAVVDDSFVYSRENVAALADSEWSTLATFSKTGELAADGSAVYGIIIYWEPTANDNLFNTKDTVKVDVSIDLLATQTTGEFDSIDENYDADAELPTLSSSVVSLAPNAQGSYEDKSFGTAGENPVETILPAEVVEALAEAGVTNATLGVSEAVVDTTANTVTFKEIAFFDENGEKIDLTNNTTPIPVKLFVGLSLAGEDVSIFHDDVFVAAATVDAEGYVSYEALHFCEVSVEAGSEYEVVTNGVYKKGNAYYISNVAGLMWMNEHADDDADGIFLPFFAGKTIYLMNDINCDGAELKATKFFQPESRTVVDGQGYTLYNVDISSQPNASSQALFNGTVDIKNLNVDGAFVQGYGYTAVLGGQLYGNIENCTVKNAQVFGGYWMTGVLAAQFNAGNIINCTVEDCEVYSPSAAGALVGVINESEGIRKIENCVVKRCTVEQNGGFGGDYDLFFGVGVGLININGSEIHFNGNSFESNILKGEESSALYGETSSSNTIYQDGVVIYAPEQ